MRYLRLRALVAIVAAASSVTAACGSDRGNGGWPDDGGHGGWTGSGGAGGTSTSSTGSGGDGGNWQPAESLCLETRPVNVVPPAGLQVRFRALDCDGNPVRPLKAGDVSVINDEKGVPFGKGGEGDSVSGVGENSNVELYSVLVLDLSNSIFAGGAVDAVIDGALAFVDETVTKPTASLKHSVAVIAFGRPDAITVEQDFTKDDALLKAKLEALRTSSPRGTTDLYDAYMMGLSLVSATGSGADSVIERFVVLLTDGTHEAGDEENLRQQALSAKHATDATVYTIGIQGNYDACRLEELAGRGLDAMSQGAGCRELGACSPDASKPASCTQFFPDADPTALSKVFEDIAARATGIARSNYVVGICTPVSLGNPTLTLSVTVDGQKDEATLPYSVSHLNGDVNTCNAESIQKGKLSCDNDNACQVVCLDKQCGTDHGVSCGSCGDKQLCNVAQHCEDVCIGMSCGTDKGVSCGSCSGNQYCDGANKCTSPCQDMDCGTDHGASCGSCSGNQYCNGANKCTSPCQGMDCGMDHGVSCGSCGSKQICDAAQKCEDVCVGMDCGTDQGVSCGACSGKTYCDATNVCLAACQGMSCGTDHGVSCGSCGSKQICDDAQKCEDVCVGMSCGTDHGVSCGSCSGNQMCSSGICVNLPPSCIGGATGQTDCGSGGNESCCLSLAVPGGTVQLDSTHTATVSDYQLDKYEITVGRFRKFVDEWVGGWRPSAGAGKHTHLNGGSGLSNGSGGYEPGWDTAWSSNLKATKGEWDSILSCNSSYQTWTSAVGSNERRPINCMTWYEAAAFCIWDGGFLPSEAEWQYAAAGGSEGRKYPWGADDPTDTLAVFCGGSCSSTQNVGSKPAGNGRWGHSDLAGNVWEWALDWYASYPASSTDYVNVSAASYRVFRGGSFYGNASHMWTWVRSFDGPSFHGYDIVGARCARLP